MFHFHWLFIWLFLKIIVVKSQFLDFKYNEIFPRVPNFILNSTTNEKCIQHSVIYLENFQNYTEWAFKSKSFIHFKILETYFLPKIYF